ncbi:MarC family protein [Aurantibacillus circumpalustris]|uniref:MarC family protein n=1 Tax=Aurantibacillus circumpalustris TaxID=3036359 RepID=UPI00295B82F9|nr:MarC family protein [Aurantibacillus circumpalustris]
MNLVFDIVEILKVTTVLFAVIDIIGSIPVVINLKQNVGNINAFKASWVSLLIMLIFLLVGQSILEIIGITVEDFAIAGSFVLFFIALEMLLGIKIYRDDIPATASIIPLAFPLIAGTGTLTTLLSIRAEYNLLSIIIAIFFNVIIVYFVLKYITLLEKLLGVGGIAIIKKVFGIVLLALAIKLFRKYTGL